MINRRLPFSSALSVLMAAAVIVLLQSTTDAWTCAEIAGIWKLETKALPEPEPTIVERALGRKKFRGDTERRILLLKLNQDGSFRQCDEGYVEGSWLSGRWVVDEEKLKFALNRQYYGPPFDIAMEGTLIRHENDGCLFANGVVSKGKWTLARSDPTFFDKGLENVEILGPFRLTQSVTIPRKTAGAERDGLLIEDGNVFQ